MHSHRIAAGLSPSSHVKAAGGPSTVKYEVETAKPFFQVAFLCIHTRTQIITHKYTYIHTTQSSSYNQLFPSATWSVGVDT